MIIFKLYFRSKKIEGKKEMKILKNRIITIAIALILLSSMVATMVVLPNAKATDPPKTWPTVSFLSVSPNPIGVGQPVSIVMFIDKANPLSQGIWGMRFSGYSINVTNPSGESEILGPFTADAISAAYTTYVPDEVGNYTIIFTFPAQVIVNTNPPPTWLAYNHPDQINDTYAKSISNTVTLIVTETPVQNWPEAPLPTDYWTRPINALNRGWAQIAGNWLAGAAIPNRYNPYSTGPESAHVLWTRPFWEGGIGGGMAGATSYLRDDVAFTPTGNPEWKTILQ